MHMPVNLLFIACFLAMIPEKALSSEKAVFGNIDKSSLSDEEYEDYIHQIYLKNYSQPVSDEKWAELSGQIPSDTYELQFKDNLWDLSGKFFQKSLYWSKLWQLNSHIGNPHRIRFKDLLSFTLDDIRTDGQKLLKEDSWQKVKTLTSEEIPSSIPLRDISISIEKFEVDVSGLKGRTVNKQVPLTYYLSSEDLSGQGEIVSKDGYGQYSFNGEDVVVRIEGEAPSSGVYTIFKNRGGFKKTLLGLLNVNGYEIAVKGSLRILGFIPETDSLYRARVIESLDSIEKGDQILPGPMLQYTLSQKGPVGPAISGEIIGAPGFQFQNMHFLYSLVYLNRGLSSNVQSGDVFYIRATEGEFGLPYEYEKPVVGQLKVVHASEEASTAVIIATREPVHVGYEFNHLPEIFSDLSKVESFEQIEDETESFESETESLRFDAPLEDFEDETDEDFDEEEEDFEDETDEDFDEEEEDFEDETDEDFEEEEEDFEDETDEDFEEEEEDFEDETDEDFDEEEEDFEDETDEDFDEEEEDFEDETDEDFEEEDFEDETDEDFDEEEDFEDETDEDFEEEGRLRGRNG